MKTVTARKIRARYPGKCPKCGQYINEGDWIDWESGMKAVHWECPSRKPAPDTPQTDDFHAGLFPLYRGYRNKPRSTVGEVFRVGRNGGKYAGKIVTVVDENKQFIPEDGMSLGLQFDRGWSVTLYCREATEDEAQTVLDDERTQLDKQTKKEEEAAARRRKDKEAQENAEELTRGLVDAGELFDMAGLLDSTKTETILEWKEVMFTSYLDRIYFQSGGMGYMKRSYGHDDFRKRLFGPREDIEKAWQATIARTKLTPSEARTWLKKYSGCSGAQMYYFASKLPSEDSVRTFLQEGLLEKYQP